jgi:arylsulfatase A-like enzyme
MRTEPADVFLLTADGLRYDRVGNAGYDRPTTPALDEIAASGAACAQAITTGTGTRRSFPGILTSSYPLMYGGYAQLSPDRTHVASAFREAGYATIGVNTNAQLHRRFGWHRGFDVYFDSERTVIDRPIGAFTNDDGLASDAVSGDTEADGSERKGQPDTDSGWSVKRLIGTTRDELFQRLDKSGRTYRAVERLYRALNGRTLPYPSATETVDRVLSFVDAAPDDRPMFCWVHFMETHSPYVPPADYRREFLDVDPGDTELWRLNDTLQTAPSQLSDADVDVISDLYDASLRYLDDEIGRLVDGLDERGRWRDAVVAFTSDHGEEFREHGGLNHCPEPYDVGLHVPLIVRLGDTDLRDVEGVVSTVDIPPTLLDAAAGFDDSDQPERFHGMSIASVLHGEETISDDRAVFAESAIGDGREIDLDNRITGCRTDQWKYMEGAAAAVVDERLFDLRTDPGEQEDVSSDHPDVTEQFGKRVHEHYQQPAYVDFGVEPAVDTGEVTDRLEALGYLNG